MKSRGSFQLRGAVGNRSVGALPQASIVTTGLPGVNRSIWISSACGRRTRPAPRSGPTPHDLRLAVRPHSRAVDRPRLVDRDAGRPRCRSVASPPHRRMLRHRPPDRRRTIRCGCRSNAGRLLNSGCPARHRPTGQPRAPRRGARAASKPTRATGAGSAATGVDPPAVGPTASTAVRAAASYARASPADAYCRVP